MTLEQFNQALAGEAEKMIAHCVALADWRSVLVSRRPYASLDALLQQSDILAGQWGAESLIQALSAHPRIGEPGRGSDKEAELSRAEQCGVSAKDDLLQQALQAGNALYEQRFGRVFLIRAKGRSGQEMLSALEQRLTNDPGQELQVSLAQLRDITRLRLRETFQ